MEGDLLVKDGENELPAFLHSGTPCNGITYADSTSISVANANFTLTAINAPFYYRLTSKSGAPLMDNKWRLHLKHPLEYGKMVEIEREFP